MRSILYTKSWYRRYNGHWKVKGPRDEGFRSLGNICNVPYVQYSQRRVRRVGGAGRREEIELVHWTQRIWVMMNG